jgi:hypothetical protein
MYHYKQVPTNLALGKDHYEGHYAKRVTKLGACAIRNAKYLGIQATVSHQNRCAPQYVCRLHNKATQYG